MRDIEVRIARIRTADMLPPSATILTVGASDKRRSQIEAAFPESKHHFIAWEEIPTDSDDDSDDEVSQERFAVDYILICPTPWTKRLGNAAWLAKVSKQLFEACIRRFLSTDSCICLDNRYDMYNGERMKWWNATEESSGRPRATIEPSMIRRTPVTITVVNTPDKNT